MKNFLVLGVLIGMVLSGCSSAQKARRDEREKIVQSKGVYCDFVSESDFQDIDIELNIRLAKKCDISKPFNISSYKRVSENPGVLYCCSANANAASEADAASSKAEDSSSGKSSSTPNKSPSSK